MALNRALASDITTVNQLLVFFSVISVILELCLYGKRVIACTVNSETREAWNLRLKFLLL